MEDLFKDCLSLKQTFSNEAQQVTETNKTSIYRAVSQIKTFNFSKHAEILYMYLQARLYYKLFAEFLLFNQYTPMYLSVYTD